MSLDTVMLRQQIERFYARVRDDETLGPLFEAHVADWDAHIERLTDFWSAIMLTSGRYKGNPHAAHLPFADRLTPQLFHHWLDLWSATARETFAPEIAAQLETKASRIAGSLMAGLLARPQQRAPVRSTLSTRPGQH